MKDTACIKKKNSWEAIWIGVPETSMAHWQAPVLPAPYFRKTFHWEKSEKKVLISICGLGYYELYLNGKKVGDHVLDPVPTQYDKRVLYTVYDVTEYLQEEINVIGVILGNGLYNCHTPETWNFDKAPWRDYPKLLLQMENNNEVLLISDKSWKVTSGPIIFDGLRNGETYDARLELDNWMLPEYEDTTWKNAVRAAPPGGILQQQSMPPCKVIQSKPCLKQWKTAEGYVYDIGQNISGWIKLEVTGESGAEVTIRYGEIIDQNNNLDQQRINSLIADSEKFQTDRYILKGHNIETWEPRFTYHGFQYVQVTIKGKAKIKSLEGRVVHTDLDTIGEFSCSDSIINTLQQCTLWSYVGNFVGIPTDCPQREKNGWTGDAHLATETGLFNFNAGSAYSQWMDSFADIQRPSGQLPSIVPTGGWGFNWGSGPAWDSAFILIPWYIYLYTGNTDSIKTHYSAMKKYVDFCTYMADDNIISFGLGDWCHVDQNRIVDINLTSTAYYYVDTLLIARFAEITNRTDDYQQYSQLAADIKKSFNKYFYKGNGIYAKGEQTAMGCALYQGLVEDKEKDMVLQKLTEAVEENSCKPDFGILGAKYIPRALADNGQTELAFRLITQPEFPGWVHWLKQGATTLWETWQGTASRNHIMFGDISAWMYQYLAGITPDPDNPGFKHMIIKPHLIHALDWGSAKHNSPYGNISVSWKKQKNKAIIDIEISNQTTADIILPDGTITQHSAGIHNFEIAINKRPGS